MTTPSPRAPAAGGVLIALGAIAGTAIGLPFGETSLGLLTGLALGSAAALVIWQRDRRR
ncbi:hypothetical protein [uncultured Sphingomonas sp.]|uniref:hypothetical protein n=1 Tax=uncultured Sphingomonas sp. TaxID=158754 RepID=UPI00261EDA4E|nr:hypothetical protein [uncultured Sphingomonas sp.]